MSNNKTFSVDDIKTQIDFMNESVGINKETRKELILLGESFKSVVDDPLKNDLWGHFGKMMKEQNEIYEGLIRTYPIESLIKIINKMYPNSIIESESMNDSTIVNIFISDENIRNGIIKLCKTYGWDIFIYK